MQRTWLTFRQTRLVFLSSNPLAFFLDAPHAPSLSCVDANDRGCRELCCQLVGPTFTDHANLVCSGGTCLVVTMQRISWFVHIIFFWVACRNFPPVFPTFSPTSDACCATTLGPATSRFFDKVTMVVVGRESTIVYRNSSPESCFS